MIPVNAIEASHKFVSEIAKPGDYVCDATAGNGFDTIFLANLVCSTGKVYSFDIQQSAIDNTMKKITKENIQDRVQLYCAGHEKIDEFIHEKISVFMFNLGYLPGSSKEVVTRPNTTLIALEKSLKLLGLGGVISIVIYTGHKGGLEEAKVVDKWSSALDHKKINVVKFEYLNKPNYPPYLIFIQKFHE